MIMVRAEINEIDTKKQDQWNELVLWKDKQV
jgi:hypothetical protein